MDIVLFKIYLKVLKLLDFKQRTLRKLVPLWINTKSFKLKAELKV